MGNFYCAAPWRGLHINARGDVKTCCAGNPNMLGNLNTKTIEEIINGPELQEIRRSLKNGNYHPYCSNCEFRERHGGDSERNWHNNVNEDFDINSVGLEYEYPTLIDVRWNNTCNLSCNYCGPPDSSKWAGLRKIPVNTATRHYYNDVCNFIEKNYNRVREVALVGGEPLLLPENERLLDVIPNDCIVTLITNLSNDLESNAIFQKLQQRTRVGWSISFDNVGDQFEYVRHGARWEKLLHNLDLIQNLMKHHGHWGGVHAVYNLYNSTRLYEFRKFIQDRGLTVRWQHLGNPVVLDPRLYGGKIVELSIKEIEKVLELCDIDDIEKSYLTGTLNIFKNSTEQPGIKEELKKFTADIESIHTDKAGQFASLWPEIYTLL